MSFSTNSPSRLMGQGNVALCIPLLTQQSQLVPRAAPVLLWVSQHYNIMCFCGEKGGKGLNLVTFFLQQNFFLFLLALIPREVKMATDF